MKQNILLFFSVLALFCKGQNKPCATQMGSDQIKELRAFQQKLSLGEVSLGKKSIQYVPLKIHILGNNKGIGYYSIHNLMQTLCDVNEDFLSTGFHFYLTGSIDYIDDDDLFNGNSDAIWNRADAYKTTGAVNVFFHGGGSEWCGVYFPGVDVVFIKNACQGANATTLTHELGHFFSLPHTFSGWESNNTPLSIEKVDGSNCRNSGDGFCDTRADYVSVRWGCPLSYNLVDPNKVSFKPDSSIYMSYSLDACQTRFSNEQMATMRNNLQGRNIAKDNENISTLLSPVLLSPVNGDTNQNASHVVLKWSAVPGAFAYHLQVARFGAFEYLSADKLISDTSATIELYGKWPYTWRVRAFTAANTCTSAFGSASTFTTYESVVGMAEIKLEMDQLNIYPNPLNAGQTFTINAPAKSELMITNTDGRIVLITQVSQLQSTFFSINDAGLYIVSVNNSGSISRKKLLVQ
ncbi:MAG: T9SS type A sorting domain-containing protein [Bacteroidia bacterium]|nr:T9SS type A sorting domain-containing protein [Bacteroidia bacterium]